MYVIQSHYKMEQIRPNYSFAYLIVFLGDSIFLLIFQTEQSRYLSLILLTLANAYFNVNTFVGEAQID